MQAQSEHSIAERPGTATNTADEFFALLYHELKRYAQHQILRLPPGQTLRPTALVHEAYLRIARQAPATWESRAHFLAVVTTVMRNILIDTIRHKCTAKRGGSMLRVTLTDGGEVVMLRPEDLLTLAQVLDKLEREHPDASRLVLMRFLSGCTMDQIANIEGVSKRTIERRWRFARAWLQVELSAV